MDEITLYLIQLGTIFISERPQLYKRPEFISKSPNIFSDYCTQHSFNHNQDFELLNVNITVSVFISIFIHYINKLLM